MIEILQKIIDFILLILAIVCFIAATYAYSTGQEWQYMAFLCIINYLTVSRHG